MHYAARAVVSFGVSGFDKINEVFDEVFGSHNRISLVPEFDGE